MGKLVTVSIVRLKLVEATEMVGWQHGGREEPHWVMDTS